MRLLPALALPLFLAPGPAWAARKLILDTDLGTVFVSHANLDLAKPETNNQTFIEHRMRMDLGLKDIEVPETELLMDVGFSLSAFGVAGSTRPVPSPFDRAAARFPTTGLNPFLSSAYVKVRRAFGQRWDLTAGRLPLTLGSGLILSDDQAGFAGILAQRRVQDEATLSLFYVQPQARSSPSGSLDVLGASLKVPGVDGTWEFSQVVENDWASPQAQNVAVRHALRSFTSARYLLKGRQITFDGEAAVQYGSAEPLAPGAKKVGFSGRAYRFTTTWLQPVGTLAATGRFTLGTGTGDRSSPGVDEAFFPSASHRYNGLQRAGAGRIFGATPFDALGGSTTTANGLPAGLSGLRWIGFGVTLPPWRTVVFSVDYLVFDADRSGPGQSASLGNEWDLAARYELQDRIFVELSYARFSAGAGLTAQAGASRLALEASGRF